MLCNRKCSEQFLLCLTARNWAFETGSDLLKYDFVMSRFVCVLVLMEVIFLTFFQQKIYASCSSHTTSDFILEY